MPGSRAGLLQPSLACLSRSPCPTLMVFAVLICPVRLAGSPAAGPEVAGSETPKPAHPDLRRPARLPREEAKPEEGRVPRSVEERSAQPEEGEAARSVEERPGPPRKGEAPPSEEGKPAQPEEGEVVEAEEIIVTGEQVPEDEATARLPSHRTVIKGEEVTGSSRDLAELVSETVGVKTNRLGGLGDFATISIRGSSADQVLVHLDGIPLNQAQGGGVNLSNIPVANIEEIEIYRGSSPLRFGASGIGGIVNVKTRRVKGERAFAGRLQYGSFSTYGANAAFSHKPGALDYLAGIDWQSSENDFEFLDDRGTQYNAADDVERRRKNNEFRALDAIGKLGYDLADGVRVALHNDYLRSAKGVPGISNRQSERANLSTHRNLSQLTFRHDHLGTERLSLDLRLYYAYTLEEFEDLLGEIGPGRHDNRNVTTGYGSDLYLEYLNGDWNRVGAGLFTRFEEFRPKDRLAQASGTTSRRRTISFGIEDEARLIGDWFILVPSVRQDLVWNDFHGDNFLTMQGLSIENDTQDRAFNWQLGVASKPARWLTLRGNLGRHYRQPSFFELFGNRGGSLGNTRLDPERSLNADAGLRVELSPFRWMRKLVFEAVAFRNDVDDLVLFIQTSQRTSQPQNIGRARVQGVELVGGIELLDHLEIRTNYTYQDSEDRSRSPIFRGKHLPGRPRHEVYSRFSIFQRDYARLFYGWSVTGETFRDRANLLPSDSRTLHDLGLVLSWKKSASLTLEARNVTDERVEDFFGYPLPGRSFFATLRFAF